MPHMNKKEVARVLNELGALLELQGENPFKARAYYNGARTIESLAENIKTVVDSGEIGNLQGIGHALEEKITELVTTGRMEYYDELKSRIPEGLFEILEIPGLGPKKVRKIWQELEVTTLGELEYACQENRLVDLDGFGAKTQDKVLEGIAFLKKYQERWLISDALDAAKPLHRFLSGHPKVHRADIAGSLRRRMETVKDIDLVASAPEDARDRITEDFISQATVEEVIARGSTKTSVRLDNGLQADLRLVAHSQFPFALHHFTGSKEHNTAMRSRARKQDLTMNEYGLFNGEGRALSCTDEREIFSALGLHYIPPELRENMGEIEFAAESEIPRLLKDEDIQGIIHVHSNYSDGVMSIRELVEECAGLGYSYLGLTDHSQSAFYANGLKPNRLEEQWEEVAAVQEAFPEFTIFRGIESDILPDGSLDYDEEILGEFDFVIASVHSHFRLEKAKQTERLLRAVQNPFTTILGHPTGRLLLAREEYEVDMNAVIEEAGATGTAIEINANPRRLDLDWRLGRLAGKHGVMTVISPDAHSPEALRYLQYGVGIARKGWFRADDVINAWDAGTVSEYFGKTRLTNQKDKAKL